MGDQPFVTGGTDHELQVRRAPGVAIERGEHCADRTVMENAVALRNDGGKKVSAELIGL
ncbi:hypothetical protein D3C80_1686120 [compost metagenome]